MPDDLSHIFSADGPLAHLLPRWQARSGQQRMASAVADVMREGGVSMIEAGTGTGKTLAYLVPAVLSGKKVIVSTGTRTLQDQLYFKDLPLVRKALGVRVQGALLKGRTNYLCLRRFETHTNTPSFEEQGDNTLHAAISDWAAGTSTGDRAELDELPDDYPAWRQITATAEQCLGQRCEQYEECFAFRARRAALAADIVIVNHHLYFADMALRIRGHGEVFPRPDVVIFDEAHQIEQVATQFLGRTVSSGRLDDLLADVRRECAHARLGGGVTDTIIDAIDKTKAGNASVFEELRSGEGRRRFSSGMLSSETLTDATDALGGLASLLESLEVGETGEALSSCAVRARNFEDDLVAILQDENPDRVTWMETRGAHMSLTSAPIELAATFEEALIASTPAILFTSATLSSGPNVEGSQGEDFAFVRSRLGVPADARAMAVESPFDYSRQALLYLPRLGVSPKSPSFQTRMPQEIGRIVNATQGRAFALFTSYRNLKAAAAHLRGKLSYPLLVQGEGSRSALLERFKLLGNAVLLATASFWEGVDVPGPALSCVIVDKLPFVPPGDPIEEARIAHLQERGENPFITYQLPKAILSLRQGLGRLIRNEEDRGVLALLDERVHTSGYGRKILSSLPPCPSTESIDDVAKFFTHPTMSETPEKPPVSPFQGQA